MLRPSVVFVNRIYPPQRGATGRVLQDLARFYAKNGWDVTVVTTGDRAFKERDGSIKVIRVKGASKPSHVLVYVWILLKLTVALFRLNRKDLVITMTDPPFIIVAGVLFKIFKKSNHVHWCQDLYPDLFPVLGARVPKFLQRFLIKFSRFLMGRADKVVVIGRCMGRHLVRTGVRAKHISVIPNWYDLVLAKPASSSGFNHASFIDYVAKGSKPYEDQLKDGPKFRIMYAGNLGRAHPVDTILKAAEILQKEHPEIEFVFVGDGARFDTIVKERAKRDLNNIRLMPYQPINRLRETLEAGDVHLISMKNEAAGMLVPCKLYSAFAVHRPCIFLGSAQTEAAKVLRDFQAGVCVSQGDAGKLVKAIKKFRLESDVWFSAQKGAVEAAEVFAPEDPLKAWLDRSNALIDR